jgi:hypothetical protein
MINRCHGKGSSRIYSGYRDRGIRVCAEWRESREAFAAYMGPKPGPKYSIDRINNDGHYEPGNVRWATRIEQASNRRPRVRRELPATPHTPMVRYALANRRRMEFVRLAKGWRPIDVARRALLSTSTVCGVERHGIGRPDTYKRIADALGIPMEEFLIFHDAHHQGVTT